MEVVQATPETPKIKKVSVNIDGVPNQLYSSGMLPHQHFEEIQKHLQDHTSRYQGTIELADVELDEFLTTKYGLWFDMRSSDDAELHGSGRKLYGATHGIDQIEPEKQKLKLQEP